MLTNMLTKIQLLETGRLVESGYCGYIQSDHVPDRKNLWCNESDTQVFKIRGTTEVHYFTVHIITGVTELVNTNPRYPKPNNKNKGNQCGDYVMTYPKERDDPDLHPTKGRSI